MAKSRRPLDGRMDLDLGDLDLFDQAGEDGASERAPRRKSSLSAREQNQVPDPTGGPQNRVGDDDFVDF